MRIIQKTSKKPLILGCIAIALLLAASLSYYVFAMNGNLFGWRLHPENTQKESSQTDGTSKIDTKPATKDEQKASDDAKVKALEDAKKKPPTTLAVGFVSATQSGTSLRVRALIQQVVTGTCTLTLTKGSSTVTKTVPTYPNASATTCQGFDIPTSELSPGKWNATLSVTAEKLTGTATTTVTIE